MKNQLLIIAHTFARENNLPLVTVIELLNQASIMMTADNAGCFRAYDTATVSQELSKPRSQPIP